MLNLKKALEMFLQPNIVEIQNETLIFQVELQELQRELAELLFQRRFESNGECE